MQQPGELQISSDRIRQLVEREGKTARNLLTWSVPAVNGQKPRERRHARRHSTPGPKPMGRGGGAKPRRRGGNWSKDKSHVPNPLVPGNQGAAAGEEACVTGQYSHRQQGTSHRGPADLRARYWSYLFDNLHRAVDELYTTCEADESVVECQEVMMTLDVCQGDFAALIRRIELQREFEKTDSQSRPSGLAWEVRKTTSPSKHRSQQAQPARPAVKEHTKKVSGEAARALDFGRCEDEQSGKKAPTWADRVRGVSCAGGAEHDEEGWKTVSRGRRPSPLSSKGSNQPSSGREEGRRQKSVSSQSSTPVTVVAEATPTDSAQFYPEASEEFPDAPCSHEIEQDIPPDQTTPPHQTSPTHQATPVRQTLWTWEDAVADFDAQESYRTSASWADRSESPPEMFSDTPRSPGRAIHLHQRLSSPSRKRSLQESKRKLQEKQVKAQQARDRIQEEKTQKSRSVSEKVREVREVRDAWVRQRREELEGKQQRANFLRSSHLQEIVRKAQEEDAKVSEIAFINTLEAQNRKIEVLERHQGHEARLLDLHEGRQRRREEQQAKEEAVQERRRALEAERVAKLIEMDQKRKEHDAKIEQMRQERERVREEAAREKARERERKLEARNAALQSSTTQLEKKIQLKQDESSRRYDQQLEQKKEKAAGSSRHVSCDDAPRVEAYQTNKWCTLCSVKIISEVYLLSHLRGRRHQEALLSLHDPTIPADSTHMIMEAAEEHQGALRAHPEAQERLKAGKKRAKKLRHRMAGRVHEQEARLAALGAGREAKHRQRLQKLVRDLNRQLEGSLDTPQLDRLLGELGRILGSKLTDDQLCFSQCGGVASLLRLLVLSTEHGKLTLPTKSLLLAVAALESSCASHTDNCQYFILSNKFAPVVDIILHFLAPPSHPGVCAHLLSLVAGVLSILIHSLASAPLKAQEVEQPITDCISYLVCTGLLDRLTDSFSTVTGPLEEGEKAQFVIAAVNLVIAVTAFMHRRVKNVFGGKVDDPTTLTVTLSHTELIGLLPLVYAILLHDGPPRHSSTPPPLSQHTLSIATATMKAINNCSILDLTMVQACLGAEGISLEFRHVVSYLLWYCSHNSCPSLLHELILAVGYFCVLNPENQVFLQSGKSPTLLQLLCGLPFEYFSNPRLSGFLYPTLISACYRMCENKAILEQEISCKLISAFLHDHMGEQTSPDFGSFSQRFPPTHWKEALQFFSQ